MRNIDLELRGNMIDCKSDPYYIGLKMDLGLESVGQYSRRRRREGNPLTESEIA